MTRSSVTKGDKLMIYVGVFLIFLPKINIISFSGQTAGLRIDDLILLVFLIYVYLKRKGKSYSDTEKSFSILILCWLFSNVVNSVIFDRSNFLYSIRYIEYFMFFYVGSLYAKKGLNLHKFVVYLAIINGIIIVLQLKGIVGGFSSIGLVSSVSDRAIGLTGGPWEISAMLNFSFAIYAFDPLQKHKKIYIYGFYTFTFILILLTGSRIPSVAHIVLLICYLYINTKKKILFITNITIIGFAMAGIFLLFSDIVSERSQNVLSIDNIEVFSTTYRNVSVRTDFKGFPEFDVYENADMSWLLRVSKWTYALKLWVNSVFAWVIGVGPGTWGTALDGGLLRILTETGVIGVVVFYNFIKESNQLNRCIKFLFLSLIINMVMIDIYISYKSMAMLFLAIGYFQFKNSEPLSKEGELL